MRSAQNSFSSVLKAELTGQKTLGFRLSVHETAEVSHVTWNAGKQLESQRAMSLCHNRGGGELSRIDNTLHLNSSYCLWIPKGHNIQQAAGFSPQPASSHSIVIDFAEGTTQTL